MRKIDNILKQHFKKRPKFDSDDASSISENTVEEEEESTHENGNEEESEAEDSESGEASETGDNEEEDDDEDEFDPRNGVKKNTENEEELQNMVRKDLEQPEDIGPDDVAIDIPGNLKRKLEQDCLAINRREKLIQLPADPNIITILEGYVKNFGVNILCATVEKQKPYTLREQQNAPPEKNIDLCKEVMDGLRVYFDFALPTVLLYNAERDQYDSLMASRKPLVQVNQKESEEVKQLMRTPNLLPPKTQDRYNSDSSEPPIKISRSSPRTVKKEDNFEPDLSDDENFSPRRITRKAFAEELQRNCQKIAECESKEKKNPPSQNHTQDTPTPDASRCTSRPRGRPRATPTPDSKKPETSTNSSSSKSHRSRARTTSEKSQPLNKAVKQEPPQKSLMDRVEPPPPLRIQCSVSEASSNDTPTSSTIERSIFRHREAAVNEIFSWKMLPDAEFGKVPPAPSLVYGAHHLLRLFVRLPDYIIQMPLPKTRIKHLKKHLELFIEYLSSRSNELFLDSAYIDAEDGER